MGQLTDHNALLELGDGATVDHCSVFIILVVSVDPAVQGVRVLLNELNRTGNMTQFLKEKKKEEIQRKH